MPLKQSPLSSPDAARTAISRGGWKRDAEFGEMVTLCFLQTAEVAATWQLLGHRKPLTPPFSHDILRPGFQAGLDKSLMWSAIHLQPPETHLAAFREILYEQVQ
ncbi:hypothetical protein E4U42_006355 [Claviceps africana]|uniref:Uncharacterized protein n=1 Tax=Claviceps africana TaxID=83212 RepID=A0A8K0JBW0_9HYPO|nr:hypothetical protein E4U42_006355 [Claviceps africana]